VPARPVATNNEPTTEGTVVGDDKTAMEAAVEANASSRTETVEAPRRGIPLAENAPDSYVVKRGDTLWGIAKVFLRDPWYWPEIWQVNPQVQNPHLIYPGDTLRLVYINGQPQLVIISEKRHTRPQDGQIHDDYRGNEGASGLQVWKDGKREMAYSLSTVNGHHILIVFNGTGAPRVFADKDPEDLLDIVD